MARAKRATVVDVAAAAGVSRATVGRYVKGEGYLSEEARAAIARAIEETGFVPSISARNLVSQRTQMVAFIVHEPDVVFTEDPNIAGILRGANAALSSAGYLMASVIVDTEADVSRVAEHLAGGFVDGCIVVSAREDDPITRAIEQFRVPAIYVGDVRHARGIGSVGIDNRGASRAITARLMDTGRHRIGVIAAALDRASGADRLAGFLDAAGDDYDERLIARVPLFTFSDGRAGMRQLLEREHRLDGVVAASDAVAAGAMSVLREYGRSVPEDVGIVGFDDSSWALDSSPQLSTVHQPALDIGRTAAGALVSAIAGEKPRQVTLPTPIVWRASA